MATVINNNNNNNNNKKKKEENNTDKSKTIYLVPYRLKLALGLNTCIHTNYGDLYFN